MNVIKKETQDYFEIGKPQFPTDKVAFTLRTFRASIHFSRQIIKCLSKTKTLYIITQFITKHLLRYSLNTSNR